MTTLLCQLTTISFVVYGIVNSVLFYRLNKKVNNNHNTVKQESNVEDISKTAE